MVNALSRQSIDAIVNRLQTMPRPRLVQVRIETGGKPPVTTWYSKLVGTNGSTQVTIGSEPLALELRNAGFGDATPQTKVNLPLLMWRWQHNCRLVPAALEVSHLAEAYHAEGSFPNQDWRQGFKVEYSELESREMNETRKACARYGHMWRKPDGELIQQDERWGGENQYEGSTACPHSVMGSPCYGPYPIEGQERAITFLTPKRLAVPKGRGGKKPRLGAATPGKGKVGVKM